MESKTCDSIVKILVLGYAYLLTNLFLGDQGVGLTYYFLIYIIWKGKLIYCTECATINF